MAQITYSSICECRPSLFLFWYRITSIGRNNEIYLVKEKKLHTGKAHFTLLALLVFDKWLLALIHALIDIDIATCAEDLMSAIGS